jgi:hypothetical protein
MDNPSPYCMADPGREYLIYLRYGGSARLDLTGIPDTVRFSYQWTDLVNSQVSKEGFFMGGKIIEIKCPEDYPGIIDFKDWVLHVFTKQIGSGKHTKML